MLVPSRSYLNGAIQLYLGDSKDILARLDTWDDAARFVDLVLTDPPYGVAYRGKKSRVTGGHLHKLIANDDKPPLWCVPLMAALMKPDRAMYLCTREDVAQWWREAIAEEGLNAKTSVVWDKKQWTMGDTFSDYRRQTEMILIGHTGRALLHAWVDGPGPVTSKVDYQRSDGGGHVTTFQGHNLGEGRLTGTPNKLTKTDTCLWSHPVPRDKHSKKHPSPKPPELMMRAMMNHSKPGDMVLDPFMGGGPVAVAAVLLGRRYLGIELMDEYFALAVENIERTLVECGLPSQPDGELF